MWKLVPMVLSILLSALLLIPSGEKLPDSVKNALSQGNITHAIRILSKDFPTHSYLETLNELQSLVTKAKTCDTNEHALSFLQEAKSKLPMIGNIQRVAEFYPFMCGIHWNITRDNEYLIFGLWSRRHSGLITEMEEVCYGSISRGDSSLPVYLGTISTYLNRGKLSEASTMFKSQFKSKEWNALRATYLFLLGAHKLGEENGHFSEACTLISLKEAECRRMSNLSILHTDIFIKEDTRKFIEHLDELYDLQPSGFFETLSSLVSFFPERARIRNHLNRAEDLFWLKLLIEAYIVQGDYARARMIAEVILEAEKTKYVQEIHTLAGKLDKLENILKEKNVPANFSSVVASEISNTSSRVVLAVLHSFRARNFLRIEKYKQAMEEAKLSLAKFRNYRALEVLGDCYAANKSSIEALERYKEV